MRWYGRQYDSYDHDVQGCLWTEGTQESDVVCGRKSWCSEEDPRTIWVNALHDAGSVKPFPIPNHDETTVGGGLEKIGRSILLSLGRV